MSKTWRRKRWRWKLRDLLPCACYVCVRRCGIKTPWEPTPQEKRARITEREQIKGMPT